LAQPPQERERERYDERLSELHAEIERDQRPEQWRAVPTEPARSQRPREPEAMNQAKAQRDGPTPLRILAPPQVLDTHVHDRQRNQRLDQAARRGHHAERGERERERVRERKTADNRQNAAWPPAHDQQPKQEQEVIVARQNVLDAEP